MRDELLSTDHGHMFTNDATPTLDALGRFRLTALQRVNQLLTDQPAADAAQDALPPLTGLLATSLEELKVAEEELRDQNERLAERSAAEADQVRRYRQLFEQLPMPAMITDVYGSIQEINDAAAGMFRRESRNLDRKPLAALLTGESREQFRKQLSRIGVDTVITDWHLEFQRLGDVPFRAHATVKLIPGLGPTASGVLYWVFLPTTNS